MSDQGLSRSGFLIVLASAIVFGLWPPCVRGIYAQGGNVVFALLITTWVRAAAMGGFCRLTRRKLFATVDACKQALVGGFFQAICLAALYAALEVLPGPLVIIILFSHTLMLLFYMVWRGEIRLDAVVVATTVAALAGLGFVLDIWHAQSAARIEGIVLALIGAVATVSRLYVYGRQTRSRHPIVVGAESFLVAAVLLTPAFLFGIRVPVTGTGTAYTLLGCAAVTLGSFGMFYGIGLIGSFRWSLFLKMEPVFTALFSAILLGEILKPSQYMGILIVLGSLAFYQINDHRSGIKPS